MTVFNFESIKNWNILKLVKKETNLICMKELKFINSNFPGYNTVMIDYNDIIYSDDTIL